jgi:hypothetical protein
MWHAHSRDPLADDDSKRGGAYFPSGFRIFTSSPCMNSLPEITFPVFGGS